MAQTKSTYPQVTESVHHAILPSIVHKRIPLFNEGHYSAHNLTSALAWERHDAEEVVSMRVWSAPGLTKPAFHEAVPQLLSDSPEVRPFKKGDWLGLSWTNHWVHVKISIPQSFRESSEPAIFEFDPSCEAMIFSLDGRPIHAITGGPHSSKDGVPGTQEDRRIEHVIPREAVLAGVYECLLEVSCNAMFGIGLNGFRHQRPDMNMKYQLKLADLVLQNTEAIALQVDFQMLSQIARAPDAEQSVLGRKALQACNDIMNTFRRVDGDVEDRSILAKTLARCRQHSQAVLGPLDEASIENLCTHNPAAGEGATVWGIGHCHIDTAWLWTYSVAQQKVARSWSTQVDLMKRFKNHQFAASSAQQYAWLEELYPTLFQEVSEMVSAQRFHPVGGAWIEHDCMLPSGESLCRQYLYGQAYFAEKFGIRSREAWLPDTFGYASQLPQILRLAGIDYFFTQKLSWNNINVFPYSTFNWCGLDGSQTLAHMTPVDTYNAQANYDELLKGVRRNKPGAEQCLLLFGNGDGGGGPTPHMLRKLQRLSSLCAQSPECPKVKIGKVADFFDDLLVKSDKGRALPTWRGELYFELHRGTYTSQAGLKKGNRYMERMLRDLEYFGTLASLMDPSYVYPKDDLDIIWKDVLLGQFHDVLPGTSIRMAIDDQLEIYERRSAQLKPLLDSAIQIVAAAGDGSSIGLDPLHTPRLEVIRMPEVPNGHLESTQASQSVSRHTIIASDKNGLVAFHPTPANIAAPRAYAEMGDVYLENSQLKVTFSQGRITGMFDKVVERELILPGESYRDAGLVLFEDFPLAYDAWDTEIYHLDCAEHLKFDNVEVLSNDQLRASVRATAHFGRSMVQMTFSLDAVLANATVPERGLIRVDCNIDWHEKHKFLKFALPVDIHAPNATYGTQFGLIERPTHRNTTLDQAKFEVCAHGLADLSEPGYGMTIASEYKYGYAVEGNVMRLSLLRAATAPDPEQDQGNHQFSFAIMPHANRLQESDILNMVLQFTNPVHLLTTPRPVRDVAPQRRLPTFKVEGLHSRGIVLETIKRGEQDFLKSDQRTIVLRLYETLGGRARGKLVIRDVHVKGIEFVNILEETISPALAETTAEGTVVDLDFRGFEIKSIRLVV